MITRQIILSYNPDVAHKPLKNGRKRNDVDIKEVIQSIDNYPLGRVMLLAWFCLEGLNPDTVPEKICQMR